MMTRSSSSRCWLTSRKKNWWQRWNETRGRYTDTRWTLVELLYRHRPVYSTSWPAVCSVTTPLMSTADIDNTLLPVRCPQYSSLFSKSLYITSVAANKMVVGWKDENSVWYKLFADLLFAFVLAIVLSIHNYTSYSILSRSKLRSHFRHLWTKLYQIWWA